MKLLVIVLVALLVGAPLVSSSWAAADDKAKKDIDKALKNEVNKKYSDYCTVKVTTKSTIKINNLSKTIYDKQCLPGPSPSDCVIGAPASSVLRVGVTADTKNNGAEFRLAQNCGTELLLVAGDLWYDDSSSGWFSAVQARGFTPANTNIACGNHDSCSTINDWLGTSTNWNTRNYENGKVQVVTVDAKESGFNCDSTQFDTVKDWLSSSNSPHKLVVVHEPFATVKSDHGPNGGFACWHSMFKDTGVDLVLQGHNHNYQQISIDGIVYTVGAPGTHDTGSSLYPCDSTTFNGQSMKCVKKNGVLFLDIADNIVGKAVDLDNKVFDSFVN